MISFDFQKLFGGFQKVSIFFSYRHKSGEKLIYNKTENHMNLWFTVRRIEHDEKETPTRYEFMRERNKQRQNETENNIGMRIKRGTRKQEKTHEKSVWNELRPHENWFCNATNQKNWFFFVCCSCYSFSFLILFIFIYFFPLFSSCVHIILNR